MFMQTYIYKLIYLTVIIYCGLKFLFKFTYNIICKCAMPEFKIIDLQEHRLIKNMYI